MRKRWLVIVPIAIACGGALLAWTTAGLAPLRAGIARPPPAELGAGASAPNLEGHVRHLSERIGPRNARHPAGMHEAADYIASALEAAGGRVSRQSVPVGHPPFSNVIAVFGSSARPPVVVGAHYDTFRETRGANDNASGVAGLLELARLLGAMRAPPPVELVAYALEEPPFFATPRMGSAVHARSHRERASELRAMIALEAIGIFSDEPGSQQYPSAYLRNRMPDRGDFIAVVGRTDDEELVASVSDAMSIHPTLPVYGYAAPRSLTGIDFSDHRSYWEQGFTAVMITDTAFLRSRTYHTRADTPERLDYERMARVVEGVFAALLELSR